MSSEESPINTSGASPVNQNNGPGGISQHDHMTLILQMQQQQLVMQQQMAQLMTQIVPNNRSKPDRPIITADCTDNKWIIFTDARKRYKDMTQLTDPNEIRNELRSSCDSTVNEMLFNFVGPDALNTATENELLAHIKSVAVKTIHPEVYRQQFFSMRQNEGESVTRFISRLKSQAMLCDFSRKCDCADNNCSTSYSEDMIQSQVITGLYNSSHQSKVLSEMAKIKTLSEMTERLITLESTSQASTHFKPDARPTDVEVIAPIRSDYQRNKIKDIKPVPTAPSTQQNSYKKKPSSDRCRGCDRNRHPKGREQCPAQGQHCNNCNKLNHFAAVCMGSKVNAITHDSTIHNEDVSFFPKTL